MRLIIFLFALLSQAVWAQVFTARIDASVTNIPGTFAGTNGLIVWLGSANPTRITSVMIDATAGSAEIYLNCSYSIGVVPAATDGHIIDVQSGLTWSTPPNTNLGNACYIESQAGTTVSTGKWIITAIGS